MFANVDIRVGRFLFRITRDRYLKHFRGKSGIEIGGPSPIFLPDEMMPIYPVVSSLDGCNFSRDTVWSGEIEEGRTYKYLEGRPPGKQHICEATDLRGIPSGEYDFLLASHVLEHTANPIKALREWSRVIKPGGMILTILPERHATFDHRRPVTTIEHLKEDLLRDTDETDLSHLPEILDLHDLSLDPKAGSKEAFTLRSQENYKNRCLHQHVFDPDLTVSVGEAAGLETITSALCPPLDIFALFRKRQ